MADPTDYGQELAILMAMEPHERSVFLHQQFLQDEERYLQWMIDQNKRDDEVAAEFVQRAKKHVSDYQLFGDEKELERAELCTEIAKGTKANKFSIADIRKQRERIQWQRNRVNKLASQPTEPKPSSSHSAS